MALVDDVRTALRGRSSALDSEIQIYIDTALYDLQRAGIDIAEIWQWNPFSFVDGQIQDPATDPPECPPEIKTAVILYVKAVFGNTDPLNKEYFWRAYESQRMALLLDHHKEL